MQIRTTNWQDIYSPGKGDNWIEFEYLGKWADKCAARSKNGLAVEVGSYHGLSTALIAQYFPKVIAIDLWGVDNLHHNSRILEIGTTGEADSWRGFLKNMKDNDLLCKAVYPICSTSEVLEALPNLNIEFAFVDACHDGEWPYLDAIRCARHLTPTGVIAFHDAFRGYVEEYETIFKGKPEAYIGHGWGYPPYDRHPEGNDPWRGVADGITRMLATSEWKVVEKAHGMVVLGRA